MSSATSEQNAPAPDKFMERDVGDLRVTVGQHGVEIRNIQNSMVTKQDLAESKLATLKWALVLFAPILASSLGALAIMLTGMFGAINWKIRGKTITRGVPMLDLKLDLKGTTPEKLARAPC